MAEKQKKIQIDMKDGIVVRTLEELRKNFDLDKALKHFQNGNLVKWLEYHFYDDELEAVEAIKTDDPYLNEKLCAALDVDYTYDMAFSERIKEKKKVLASKTDDENIIKNAAKTALDQEDLSDLIHMNEPIIYLCGESFNVPLRVSDKQYIGILGMPKIVTKAKSQAELDAKNIKFENCNLPWKSPTPQNISPNSNKMFILIDLAKKIFGNRGNYFHLLSEKKSSALRRVCKDYYNESQIAYMYCDGNYSGFALTIDSFCINHANRELVLNYTDIKNISVIPTDSMYIYTTFEDYKLYYGSLFSDNKFQKIKNFIENAKRILN